MSEAKATPSERHEEAHEHGPRADARPEMLAADALALLAEGKPVEGVRIRRLKLRGEFAHPVLFKNCTLFQAEIGAATFKADLTFVGCSLDRLAFVRPCTIEGSLGFNHSQLNRTRIYRLTVKGKSFFGGSQFRGTLLFEKCEFHEKLSWWEAHSEAWVEFKDCSFLNETDMRSAHFDQGLIFAKCRFAGDFLLRGATVDKKFQADGCRFEKLLDLSKAKLHDFVYLEQIEQGPEMRLAINNALTERLLIRPEQIEGRLASEQTGKHEEAMQEYGLLKKCYQGLHRFDAEDWAFYRFKVNQRRANTDSWSRPWTKLRRFSNWLFLDVGCGYGTNPVRAVRMAAVIIIAFAMLYAACIGSFYSEKLPFPDDDATGWSNRLMIGFTTSISVFTSGMGGIREVAKGWMNVPVMIESVMGTLLFGLFIVAFSRKVIR